MASMSDTSADYEALPPALPPRRPEPPPLVHALYEELTETWQYIVADPVTRHGIIIDPHLDNGPSSTEISTIAADRLLTCIGQNQYIIDRILHTHEPTQHPTSAWYLRAQILQSTGRAPKVQIGKKMAAVQRVFKRKYSMNDGSAWKTDFDDCQFADGDIFFVGDIHAVVLHLVGGHLAFVIGRHIFAGSSRFDLDARNVFGSLLGDLKDYQVYTSGDKAPERTARLTPIFEKAEQSRMPVRKKLVIRYAAELEE